MQEIPQHNGAYFVRPILLLLLAISCQELAASSLFQDAIVPFQPDSLHNPYSVATNDSVGRHDSVKYAEINLYSGERLDRLEVLSGQAVNVLGGTVGYGADIHAGGAVFLENGSVERFLWVRTDGHFGMRQGSLGHFALIDLGATARISGGVVDDNFQVSGEATITGGTFGSSFEVNDGGTVRIDGGTIGEDFYVSRSSSVHISGGSFEGGVTLFGATGFVSGGIFEGPIIVRDSSVLSLSVVSASVGGQSIDLTLGGSVIVRQRDGLLLNAVLEDGSDFTFTLNDHQIRPPLQSYITSDSVLILTRIPEPSTSALVLAIGISAFASATRRQYSCF